MVGSEQTLHNNKRVREERWHCFVSVAMESRVKIDTLWSSRTRNVLFGSLKSNHSDSSSVPTSLATHPTSFPWALQSSTQHQSCLPPALHGPSTRAASLQLASARTPARALQAPLVTHTTLAGASDTGYRSRAEIWSPLRGLPLSWD